MKPRDWVRVLCAGVTACAPAMAQEPVFRGVGDLPGGAFVSRALGVAPAGNIVVVGESQGAAGWRAFRWTPSFGIEDLGVLSPGDAFSSARAISFGAFMTPEVIVGASGFAPSVFESAAFRWTRAGGLGALGLFGGGGTTSLAHAVSLDGQVIVGEAGANPGGPRAFRWTAATGAVGLGTLPGGGLDNSSANGVSSDGLVIVGRAQDAPFAIQAFMWTAGTGMVGLGYLNASGFQDSRAWAVSPDGLVVVGESTSPNGPQEAFRWTQAGGIVGLGDLPGGAFRSAALAARYDGSEVVGWSDTASGNRAFIWDAANGMRDLRTVLEAQGFNVTGWTLLRATGISWGKRVIVGEGINPLGQPEGWVADFGCRPDCNSDGMLTIADFGCFQTRWVAQDPWADCDGSGGFTVADFGCWRTVFVQGCP